MILQTTIWSQYECSTGVFEERRAVQVSLFVDADILLSFDVHAVFRVRVSDLENITEERNRVRGEHESLRRQRLEEFMNGFGVITLKLKEMYQMITLGTHTHFEHLTMITD